MSPTGIWTSHSATPEPAADVTLAQDLARRIERVRSIFDPQSSAESAVLRLLVAESHGTAAVERPGPSTQLSTGSLARRLDSVVAMLDGALLEPSLDAPSVVGFLFGDPLPSVVPDEWVAEVAAATAREDGSFVVPWDYPDAAE